MLVRAPYILFFVLTVYCWFQHNVAIPFTPYSSVPSQVQNIFKEKKVNIQNDWDNVSKVHIKRDAETKSVEVDKNGVDVVSNLNDPGLLNKIIKNQNINLNIIDRHHSRHKRLENFVPKTTTHNLEDIIKEDQSMNCTSSKKENERYSSSFVGNTTNGELNIDKEFDEVIGNNSKTKKTSSVHVGEDITLCWIEITTIKVNKTVRPMKRLVIREYMISFENSATIPDRYLECKRLEGEVTPNDPEIGKTVLFDVIDENTKVSRTVNLTAVSHVGDVVVWQHKKVKCGVGPVVSKNIIEWNDGSENPKKRVEIKVSPKIRSLTATESEEEPCTEETKEDSTEFENTNDQSNVIESCENTESGICEISAESNESLTHYEVSTTEETDGEDDLNPSTSVIELSTSFREKEFTTESMTTGTTIEMTPSTISEQKESNTSKRDTEDCEKDSLYLTCMMRRNVTPEFEESNELSISSTTNAMTISNLPVLPINEEIITEKNIFDEEKVLITTESSLDLSKEETSGDNLVTIDSVEDYDTIKPTKSTSKEFDKTDYISHKTMTSNEVVTEQVITTASLFKVVEFTDETDESGKILNPPQQSSIVTDNIEPLLISEEARSTEETVALATGETTIGIQDTTEKEFIPVFLTTSLPKIEPTTLSPVIGSEVNSCENSDNCSYVSESETNDYCDKSGNCYRKNNKSCESDECSKEKIENEIDYSMSEETPSSTTTTTTEIEVDLSATELQLSEMQVETKVQHTSAESITTTTTLTTYEAENSSTAINNGSTIADSRRSTLSSSTSDVTQHKLNLKVKVVVEHVNDKQEKQNLIEVEKYLTFNESLEQHEHPDLLEQLKSLNSSVNMETISALLNCTSLSKFANIDLINEQSNDTIDDNLEESELTYPSMSELFSSENVMYDDLQYPDSDLEYELLSQRRRRRSLRQNPFDPNSSGSHLDDFSTILKRQNMMKKNTPSSAEIGDVSQIKDKRYMTGEEKGEKSYKIFLALKNNSKKTKMEALRKSLPEIKKDILAAWQRVMSQVTQSNMTSGDRGMTKTNILNIIADPKDNRIHSRKRRANEEEIGHWSNEKLSKASIGGSFRSITEFTLYKESFFK